MPYEIGDTEPPHIDVHNALNAEVAELSTRSGIEVVLPPIVSLGDTGHVSDHNLYTTAIQKIADGIGPALEPAPIVTPPTSTGKPGVTSSYVRNTEGTRLVAYVLPGNTGTGSALALTEEGAAALAARRDVLDAIATTEVPDDFEGDPVTLLPKKLRAELKGFLEVRATALPPSEFSVTLGAGVFPGVLVGAGGMGGVSYTANVAGGGGGAGGVVGAGTHVPIVLPTGSNATYRISVASSTASDNDGTASTIEPARPTTIAFQEQEPFGAALGGGWGGGSMVGFYYQGATGASGGGARGGGPTGKMWQGEGLPGQGNRGGEGGSSVGLSGGGGGYSLPGAEGEGSGADGGAGFDLVTALNLDGSDPQTQALLSQVTVDGYIAGGGAGYGGDASGGGGFANGGTTPAKDFTGGGGGGQSSGQSIPALPGAAGMAIIIGPA